MIKPKTSREAFEEYDRGVYAKAGITASAANRAHEWDGERYTCQGTQDHWETWKAACRWADRMED